MIQQGKHEAYSQLIEQNTTLIRAVATQFAKHHSNTILSCDDYEQEGRLPCWMQAKQLLPRKRQISDVCYHYSADCDA